MRAVMTLAVCLVVVAASFPGGAVAALGSTVVPAGAPAVGADPGESTETGGAAQMAPGNGSSDPGAESDGGDGGTFGASVSSFVQSTAAETDSVVDNEMWAGAEAERSAADGSGSGESDDDNRTAARERVERRVADLREQLREIRSERRSLVTEWRDGGTTELTFRSRMASVDGRLNGLNAAVNETARFAREEGVDVDDTGIDALRADIDEVQRPTVETLIERHPDAGAEPVSRNTTGTPTSAPDSSGDGSGRENGTPSATAGPDGAATGSTPTADGADDPTSAPNVTTGPGPTNASAANGSPTPSQNGTTASTTTPNRAAQNGTARNADGDADSNPGSNSDGSGPGSNATTSAADGTTPGVTNATTAGTTPGANETTATDGAGAASDTATPGTTSEATGTTGSAATQDGESGTATATSTGTAVAASDPNGTTTGSDSGSDRLSSTATTSSAGQSTDSGNGTSSAD